MGEPEPDQIEGTLVTGGLTPREQVRHSALFVAVDVAKQIPAGPGETVDERLALVLAAAERLCPWLAPADAPQTET